MVRPHPDHRRPERGDAALQLIRTFGSFTRGEGGQTVVEFALAVGVLLVIVLGLIDLGRAVWYSDTLSFATREGARYAIVHGSVSDSVADEAAVRSVVQRYLVGVNGTVTITATWCSTSPCATPDGNEDPGSFVTVSATAPYTPLASRYFLGGALRVTLSGGTTMVIRQ